MTWLLDGWLLGAQSFEHRVFVYCAEADINESLSVGIKEHPSRLAAYAELEPRVARAFPEHVHCLRACG